MDAADSLLQFVSLRNMDRNAFSFFVDLAVLGIGRLQDGCLLLDGGSQSIGAFAWDIEYDIGHEVDVGVRIADRDFVEVDEAGVT